MTEITTGHDDGCNTLEQCGMQGQALHTSMGGGAHTMRQTTTVTSGNQELNS